MLRDKYKNKVKCMEFFMLILFMHNNFNRFSHFFYIFWCRKKKKQQNITLGTSLTITSSTSG